MKRPLPAIIVWLSISTFIVPANVTQAGPIVEFFRVIRSAIPHPREKPRRQRSRHKNNENPPSDVANTQTSVNTPLAPPGRGNVLWAKSASGSNQQNADLSYGTPVAGKPGLVTSPFAPNSGYVDVTGFPPGTAVEDPYTGKIFLTP